MDARERWSSLPKQIKKGHNKIDFLMWKYTRGLRGPKFSGQVPHKNCIDPTRSSPDLSGTKTLLARPDIKAKSLAPARPVMKSKNSVRAGVNFYNTCRYF